MDFERHNKREKLGRIIPFYQNGEFYFNKGLIAYQKKQVPKAVKLMETAIKLSEDEPMFHCQLAAVLSELGQYERSNEILQYVLDELDSSMDECYFFMANNFAYLGLFDKAEESAKKYMSISPDGEFSHDSDDLLDLLKFEKEDDDLDEEEDLIIEYDYICRLVETEKYELAIKRLETMMNEYPTFWPAYNHLSTVLFDIGRKEEALQLCKEVLEKDKGNLIARCNLAQFYYKNGQKDEADSMIRLLICVLPIDFDHRFKVASTLCMVGYYAEAHKLLLQLEKRFYGQKPSFFRCLAVAAYHNGDMKKAFASWKIAGDLGDGKAKEILTKEENHLLTEADVFYD
ncbi:tetratricopeptide repeat protein [Bacillus sp. FJAT-45350]|uniref:tetratricopeptide repeat protein n=1 Tax=Bacillus sp. FJAT-45350 TaxID=2011014 RepID=UPI000BB6DB98|nr:tetratricopeptide repeat protein [Bacillus sp. FJAT-45350]